MTNVVVGPIAVGRVARVLVEVDGRHVRGGVDGIVEEANTATEAIPEHGVTNKECIDVLRAGTIMRDDGVDHPLIIRQQPILAKGDEEVGYGAVVPICTKRRKQTQQRARARDQRRPGSEGQ